MSFRWPRGAQDAPWSAAPKNSPWRAIARDMSCLLWPDIKRERKHFDARLLERRTRSASEMAGRGAGTTEPAVRASGSSGSSRLTSMER